MNILTTGITLLAMGLLIATSPARAADPVGGLDLGSGAKIQNFRVPNYDDLGILTSQIFGQEANVLPNGNIEIDGLRIEFYVPGESDDRPVEMTVTSPSCLFNRARGTIVSDDDIQIRRSEFVITGTGFNFNNAEQSLHINSNSKVVLRGASRSFVADGDEEMNENE
jgi:hypothetical protein